MSRKYIPNNDVSPNERIENNTKTQPINLSNKFEEVIFNEENSFLNITPNNPNHSGRTNASRELYDNSNCVSGKNSPVVLNDKTQLKPTFNKSNNKDQYRAESGIRKPCNQRAKFPDSSESEKIYTMRELACNLRDAVVSISGQTVLTSIDGTESIITHNGNGFFIKGHYIICPADLVLVSPAIFDKKCRNPKYNQKGNEDNDERDNDTEDNNTEDNNMEDNNDKKDYFYPEGTDGKYLNSMIRVSKILVDVSNVNGSGKSYGYVANIIGVDGAANIAVLCINMDNEWNRFSPPIRTCHPFLQWGKSRSSCPGDTIIVIGNISAPSTIGLLPGWMNESLTCHTNILQYPGSENGVIIGNISDNRYVFPGGQVPGELLLLSNVIAKGFQRGLPVITMDGTIIGMTLHIHSSIHIMNNSDNITMSNYNTTILHNAYISDERTFYPTYNVALSEFFMRRPVKAIIRTYQDNCIPGHYVGFIEHVNDPIGNYYRFNKAWLGISGILMGQEDYNTNISVSNIMSEITKTCNITIVKVPMCDGGTLTNGPKCKELVGYRVLSVLRDSPLCGTFNVGDIITHINGCPLGDRKGQISPSLVMWRVRPGDAIFILYKKQSELFEIEHEIKVFSCSYVPFIDFPFYTFALKSLRNMLPTLM